MASIPKVVQRTIEAFERLPGIGPKTAQRLTYYLLHAPKEEAQALAQAALDLKEKTVVCSICFNISETDPCEIDTDPGRDKSIVAVVEDPLDILALERTNFRGLYHCLHGVLNPLDNIGPDQLYIKQLLPRLKDKTVKEIILATNPTFEGESTASYLTRVLSPYPNLKITRIGRGLPVGGDLEYADETTLTRALEGRKEY